MSERQMIRCILDIMSEANAIGFELNSEAGRAFAFWVDTVIKHGTVLYYDKDFLDAAWDYNQVDQEIYEELNTPQARQMRDYIKLVRLDD